MYKLLPITTSKIAKTFLRGAVLFAVFVTIGILIGNSIRAEAEGTVKYERPAWCAQGFACVTAEDLGGFYDDAIETGRASIIKFVMDKCTSAKAEQFWMQMGDTEPRYFVCSLEPGKGML